MSNVESDIHQALTAQAEVMIAALGYPALWSQKGGDKPVGEHVTVMQLPNDNDPMELSGQVMDRRGFFIVTLVSPLDVYEIVTKRKAGDIAAYFKRGTPGLTANDTTVTIFNTSVRQGREENERWETPIWIDYRSIT
jgi:hypothetical protein